jgi:hypothetical protein
MPIWVIVISNYYVVHWHLSAFLDENVESEVTTKSQRISTIIIRYPVDPSGNARFNYDLPKTAFPECVGLMMS